MKKKILHFIVFCAFTLSTSLLYAAPACACPSMAAGNMEMPCHDMDDANKASPCCDNGCLCDKMSSSQSIQNLPPQTTAKPLSLSKLTDRIVLAHELLIADQLCRPPIRT